MANTVTITVDADTKKAEKNVKGMGGKFKTAMKGVAMASGGLTLAAGAAAKLGQEYQEATNTIAAGTGATGEQLEGLTQSFKDVWASVPQDAATVSAAIADVNTEMGLEGDALEDVTKAFLDVSRAMGEEAGPMIKSVADSMIAFGVPAEETRSQLDKLTEVSQAVGVPMSSLADTVVKFGPQLATMGLSLDESTALIGNMEAAGLDAGKMMPGLNTAIKKLASEGVTDMSVGLQDAIANIQNASSDTEALGLATDLFGAGAGIRFKDAIDKGAFSLDDLMAAMEGSEGKVAELGAATLTMSDKFDIMKNRTKAMLSPIGELATGLGPMVIMIPAIATGMSALGASQIITTAATWLQTAAMAALNIAMGPAGLIILGVALAIAGIVLAIKNWSKVQAAFQLVWDKFRAGIEWLRDEWKGIWDGVETAFKTVMGLIETVFNSKFAWLLPGGALIKAILFIKKHWEDIWAAIRILAIVAWEKISEVFVDKFGWALPGGVLHTALDKIMKAWSDVWGSIKDKFSAIAGFVVRIWEDNFGWLRPGGAIHKALDSFREKWSSVWDAIKGFVKGPVNFIVGGVNKLIDVFNALEIGWEAKKVKGVTVIPGFTFAPFNIPHIPKMAAGGIVTSPTLAMLGERGPEAVIPLGRGGAGGITINILGPTYGFDDFERRVSEAIRDGVRRGGYQGILATA